MSSIAQTQPNPFLILRPFFGFLLAIFTLLITISLARATTGSNLMIANLLIFSLPLTTLSLVMISNYINEITRKDWSLRIGVGFSLLSFAYLMLGNFWENGFEVSLTKQLDSNSVMFDYLLLSFPINTTAAFFIGRYLFNAEIMRSENARIGIAIGSAAISLISLVTATFLMTKDSDISTIGLIFLLDICLPSSAYSLIAGISNLFYRSRKLQQAEKYGNGQLDNSILNKLYLSLINIAVGLLGVAINIIVLMMFLTVLFYLLIFTIGAYLLPH